MVDNFDLIKNLLEFRSKDDFYFVQILQRKKDVKPDDIKKITGPNSNARLIKMYCVHSQEYLDGIKNEIVEICNLFNARAGIDLNRKSYQQCALQSARLILDQIANKEYTKAIKAYSSVCGRYSNENNKKWIIDIDGDKEVSSLMLDYINYECEPISKFVEDNKIYTTIPSKNGCHIITKPFNLLKFKEKYSDIDVQKMSPTNLYIP